MKRFSHPLFLKEYAAVPQRQELAHCCLCGKVKESARKPSEAWQRVTEQPAAQQGQSSRFSYGINTLHDLGTVTLFSPTFDDPASHEHLWACGKCIREATAAERAAEAAAAAAMLSLAASAEPPRAPAPAPHDMLTRAAAAQQQHLASCQEKEEQEREQGADSVAQASAAEKAKVGCACTHPLPIVC